jgi:hypothetical protein
LIGNRKGEKVRNPFAKKKMPAEERWLLAKSEEANLPMIYRIRQETPPGIRLQEFPFLVNIHWHYENVLHNGFPPEDVLLRMNELEEHLDQIEADKIGFMVISVTGNCRKEWVWYAADKRIFVEKLNSVLEGLAPFPIGLATAEDPAWESYKSLLAEVKSG